MEDLDRIMEIFWYLDLIMQSTIMVSLTNWSKTLSINWINSHELLECAFSPYTEHLDIYRNPGSAKYINFKL